MVVKTTNGGTTWALANTGLTGNDFYTISALDANICMVGAGDGGLWRTTNGGANWSLIPLTPPAVFNNVVHFFDANNVFVQGDPTGNVWKYYISTNGGVSFTLGANAPASVGSEAGWNNSYMALDTGNIWWGTNASKIWHGGFRGPFSTGATPGRVNSFGVAFDNASTGTAAFQTLSNFVTTNGGSSWSAGAFTPSGTPFALKSIPGTQYMFLGTSTQIYRSTNSGTSFTSQFTLPAGRACYALTFVNKQYGWAGTQAGNIYRYTDPTGIDPNNSNIPAEYSLQQNYPNPFNPVTTIKYSLPKSSFVTLNIYNALGSLVKSVVSTQQAAGNYIEDVDMSSFATGIYFYTLTAGDFKETKKV